MRKIQRLAAIGVLAALTYATAACGYEGSVPDDGRRPGPAPGDVVASQLFGNMCDQLPNGNASGSPGQLSRDAVATAMDTSAFLATLSAGLRSADLVDSFNQMPEATVFAPYNSAFDQLKTDLGEERYNDLLADKLAFEKLMRNHVLDTRLDRPALVGAGTVRTIGGAELRIAQAGDTMEITDGSGGTAYVLCGGIPTANANIYMIDSVLLGEPL